MVEYCAIFEMAFLIILDFVRGLKTRYKAPKILKVADSLTVPLLRLNRASPPV